MSVLEVLICIFSFFTLKKSFISIVPFNNVSILESMIPFTSCHTIYAIFHVFYIWVWHKPHNLMLFIFALNSHICKYINLPIFPFFVLFIPPWRSGPPSVPQPEDLPLVQSAGDEYCLRFLIFFWKCLYFAFIFH